jgi:hypothetical protein
MLLFLYGRLRRAWRVAWRLSPKHVVIESPYADDDPAEIEENEQYARAAMRWCLLRGMYPYASHLLYTQKGILDDKSPEERRLGIEAGLSWSDRVADTTFVFVDRGITKGMRQGIKRARRRGRGVVEVELGEDWRRWLGPTAQN